MITLYQDLKPLAKIELIDGKLKIDYIKADAAKDILKGMRYINERKLTDEEVYQTLPARLHGRILAASDDPKADSSVYERIHKEGRDVYLARPDVQRRIAESKARVAKAKAAQK